MSEENKDAVHAKPVQQPAGTHVKTIPHAANPVQKQVGHVESKPARTKKVSQPKQADLQFDEIFDASGAIVGRLAAFVVKILRQGKAVAIINAEKAIISGNPKGIVERYFNKRQMQNKSNPEHSPKWPRRPDFMYKKILSGMIPNKPSGRAAFRRLRIYVGIPKELASKPAKKYGVKIVPVKFITLQDLCVELGWQHEKQNKK